MPPHVKDHRIENEELKINGVPILTQDKVIKLMDIEEGAALLVPFFSHPVIYDEQGAHPVNLSALSEEARADKIMDLETQICDKVSKAGFSGVREGLPSFLATYLLGLDETSTIEDIMSVEKAVDKKAKAGNNLLKLLHENPISEETKRSIDETFIKGLRRLNEATSKLATEFAKTGDLSSLLKPEKLLLIKLSCDTYLNHCDETVDFFKRLQEKKDTNLEKELSSLRSFFNWTPELCDISSYIQASDKSTVMLHAFIQDQLIADRIHDRYLKNPEASLEELYPTRLRKTLNEVGKKSPMDMDDLTAIRLDLEDEMTNYDPGNANPAAINPYLEEYYDFHDHLKTNPALYTGAGILGMQGKLFKNISYEIEENGRNQKLTNFTFNHASDSEMLAAAYLSGIPAPAMMNVADPLKDLRDGVDSMEHLIEKKNENIPLFPNNSPLSQKMRNIIETTKKMTGDPDFAAGGYVEMIRAQQWCADLKKQLSDIQEQMQGEISKANDDITAVRNDQTLRGGEKNHRIVALENKKEELQKVIDHLNPMIAGLDKITEKSKTRRQWFEAGARQPERTTKFGSDETKRGRYAELHHLLKELKELQTTGMSPEWTAMKHALEQAESASNNIKSGKGTGVQNLLSLNTAMSLLKDSARQYIEHKVKQKGFDSGKDLKRLNLAAKLEGVSIRELKQSEPELSKTFEEYMHKDEHKNNRESWLENRRNEIKQALVNLGKKKEKNAGAGDSFSLMKSCLKTLSNNLNGEVSNKTLLEVNYQPALKLVDEYLADKEKLKEKDSESLRRIFCAREIRIYLNEAIRSLSKENQLEKAQAAEQDARQNKNVRQNMNKGARVSGAL